MPLDAIAEYRLGKVEKAVEVVQVEKADKEDLNQIASEVRGLRKTLVQFMVTIAGASVLFSFTVLQLLAQH